MARPEITGRASLNRKGKSPAEWCRQYGISRSTFNNWKRKNIGPAVTQPAGPGGKQIITDESDADWRRAHTALAAVIEGAAK